MRTIQQDEKSDFTEKYINFNKTCVRFCSI